MKIIQIEHKMIWYEQVSYGDWLLGYWYENFILSPNELSPSEISSKYNSIGGDFIPDSV